MDNPVVSNIFGTIGAVCWSIQILKNYRNHSTDGLHGMMYLSWALSGIPLGVYNTVQNLNIALQVQPHVLILLSLVTWSQCQYYGARWKCSQILVWTTGVAVVIGGIEVGLYFALRLAWSRGNEWPMTLMAVLAAVLLCIGVLRYYWEIYRSRDVIGISFTFVLIDFGGDIASIVELVFATRLDVLGLVLYSVEAVLWMGIQCLGIYLRMKPLLGAQKSTASKIETSQQLCVLEARQTDSEHQTHVLSSVRVQRSITA